MSIFAVLKNDEERIHVINIKINKWRTYFNAMLFRATRLTISKVEVEIFRKKYTPWHRFDYRTKSIVEINEGFKWRCNFALNTLEYVESLLSMVNSYSVFTRLISDEANKTESKMKSLHEQPSSVATHLIYEALQKDKSLANKSDDDITFLVCEGLYGSLAVLKDFLKLK